MTARTKHPLEDALDGISGRCRDESFARELYRGLAGRRWRHDEAAETFVSWSRAEQLVNRLRRKVGYEPMMLTRSGGEGRLTDDVRDELAERGWHCAPPDTSTAQPARETSPEVPPSTGEDEQLAQT